MLLSRVTHTASRKLYPFGTALCLTGKYSWAVKQFFKQEQHAYPAQPFAEPQQVTIVDSGTALNAVLQERCIRRQALQGLEQVTGIRVSQAVPAKELEVPEEHQKVTRVAHNNTYMERAARRKKRRQEAEERALKVQEVKRHTEAARSQICRLHLPGR
eukprot:6194396-Pleurochrysis_carterae.AAC.1